MITNFKVFEQSSNFIKDKIYEMNEGNPQVGDYVICGGDDLSCQDKSTCGYSNKERDFMFNKIGRIIKIGSSGTYPYAVTYDDIPSELNNGDITSQSFILVGSNIITYCSNDKEELEQILTANKFNI